MASTQQGALDNIFRHVTVDYIQAGRQEHTHKEESKVGPAPRHHNMKSKR
jgi:hypothetical protein